MITDRDILAIAARLDLKTLAGTAAEDAAKHAARIVHEALISAAGKAFAAEAAISAGRWEQLARQVARAAESLLIAIEIDPEVAVEGRLMDDVPDVWRHRSAAGLSPGVKRLLSAGIKPAIPPQRGYPFALQWIFKGSAEAASLVEARTDMLTGNRPTAPTDAMSGAAEGYVMAGLMALPDALGALLALARAVEVRAASMESAPGRKNEEFAPAVLAGIARAYHVLTGQWPRPQAANRPHAGVAIAWAQEVLAIAERSARPRLDDSSALAVARTALADRVTALVSLAPSTISRVMSEAVVTAKFETRG